MSEDFILPLLVFVITPVVGVVLYVLAKLNDSAKLNDNKEDPGERLRRWPCGCKEDLHDTLRASHECTALRWGCGCRENEHESLEASYACMVNSGGSSRNARGHIISHHNVSTDVATGGFFDGGGDGGGGDGGGGGE